MPTVAGGAAATNAPRAFEARVSPRRARFSTTGAGRDAGSGDSGEDDEDDEDDLRGAPGLATPSRVRDRDLSATAPEPRREARAETAEARGAAAGTSRVERHRWEGFFVPDDVIAALAFCRRVVAGGAKPWAALTAWGFPDDPSRDTALDTGGDGGGLGGGEHVTFVVVPGDGYVMYTQTER